MVNLIHSLSEDNNSIIEIFDQNFLGSAITQCEVQSKQTIAFNIIYKRGDFMSTKQFISAEEHLAKLGITVQQANDFIIENVENPGLLYSTARQNGVTNEMLSEITSFSTDTIRNYFESSDSELVVKRLDYTGILFNTDIGALKNLVDFNNNTGILSTDSLREEVKSLIDFSTFYDFPFTARYDFQPNDGIYDADELGVSHLGGDITATDENIESLFYGTLINMFSVLDETELSQINTFPQDGNSEGFQMLLADALSDSPTTTAWTDEALTNLVVNEAVYLHNHYIQDDFVIGLFDHSYLGYAPIIH